MYRDCRSSHSVSSPSLQTWRRCLSAWRTTTMCTGGCSLQTWRASSQTVGRTMNRTQSTTNVRMSSRSSSTINWKRPVWWRGDVSWCHVNGDTLLKMSSCTWTRMCGQWDDRHLSCDHYAICYDNCVSASQRFETCFLFHEAVFAKHPRHAKIVCYKMLQSYRLWTPVTRFLWGWEITLWSNTINYDLDLGTFWLNQVQQFVDRLHFYFVAV